MFENLNANDLIPTAEGYIKDIWGYEHLWEHQREAVVALHQSKDVLMVTPTGSGKSMSYVLPALMSEGLAIVVSPLIALMRDQIFKLQQLQIPAASLDSIQSVNEKKDVWHKIQNNELKLLYVAPERLAFESFKERIRSLRISLIAVDEAHCISEWGHGFRPEYSKIGENLSDFSHIRKLALTATSTERVRKDIIETLKLKDVRIIHQEVMRENLHVKIFKSESAHDQLLRLYQSVKNENGQGIIYAPTRAKVDQATKLLSHWGLSCQAYHAGLSVEERTLAQQKFVKANTQITIATKAFGLGIDKKDIRFVYHLGIPSSLEQYIQEIGRAGRDAKSANAFLFFNSEDLNTQKFLLSTGYPDCKTLKKVYFTALQLIKTTSNKNIRFIASLASNKLGLNVHNIVSHFKVLHRVKLLQIDQSELGVNFGQNIDQNVWISLEQMRKYQLYKLQKMYQYISTTTNDGRISLLKNYFSS